MDINTFAFYIHQSPLILLQEENRTVTDRQWKIVQVAISKCNLPLFVKLVYDEIIKWRSYRYVGMSTCRYVVCPHVGMSYVHT